MLYVLSAIIECKGNPCKYWQRRKNIFLSLQCEQSGLSWNLSHHEESTLPFELGMECSSCFDSGENTISFPMTKLFSREDSDWTLIDIDSSGNTGLADTSDTPTRLLLAFTVTSKEIALQI